MCKSQYESPSSIVYKSGDESAAMYITICPVCMPLTLVLQITHCKTCYIHSCGVHNSSTCFAHMHYICMPTWLCCFVGALWIQLSLHYACNVSHPLSTSRHARMILRSSSSVTHCCWERYAMEQLVICLGHYTIDFHCDATRLDHSL